MSAHKKHYRRIKMNLLGPAGLSLNVTSLILAILASLCIFKVIFIPMVGGILGVLSLVFASIGLTMAGIARSEIVENVQDGDEYAVSGMVVGIVMCALCVAVLTLYFVFYG